MGFSSGSWVKNLPAMQETLEIQVQFLGWEDPLEEGMATHSSILVWEIPLAKEPDGLWSVGPHRVRCNWIHMHHTLLNTTMYKIDN